MQEPRKEETYFCTRDEAAKILRTNRVQKTRIIVISTARLRIDEGSYFESISVIPVSNKDALRIINDTLSITLEARGGRIKLRVSTELPSIIYPRGSCSIAIDFS